MGSCSRCKSDLHVLAFKRNAEIALVDTVGKAWKRGQEANDECDNGTPIGAKFGRVTIDAVKSVHVWYGHIATTGDVVAEEHESEYCASAKGYNLTHSTMMMAVMGPRKMV